MSVLGMFGLNRIPEDMHGATLIVGSASTLAHAEPLRATLESRLGSTGLAVLPTQNDRTPPPANALPLPPNAGARARLLHRAAPTQIVLLGELDAADSIAQGVSCPVHWVNAPAAAVSQRTSASGPNERILKMVSDPRLGADEPDVHVTGDPLLGIDALPDVPSDHAICERFRDHRQAGRWIGYFAATGEGEETLAYGTFFKLTRHQMGLLILAPHDPQRYEPVYRDAIKYNLPTNRHNRLSTSFVPIKTRVYYIEDPETLSAMYGCADFVVAGATLCADARHAPDVLSPIRAGAPVVVGPQRHGVTVAAALRDGAVIGAKDEDTIVEAVSRLLDDDDLRGAQIERATAWAAAQTGALERVVEMIIQGG